MWASGPEESISRRFLEDRSPVGAADYSPGRKSGQARKRWYRVPEGRHERHEADGRPQSPCFVSDVSLSWIASSFFPHALAEISATGPREAGQRNTRRIMC